MRIIDIITTANESLLRNKARTILTIIAIFIGATTLSLTSGIGAGVTTYLDKQVGNLGNSNSLTITATSNGNNISTANSGLVKYDSSKKKISTIEGRPGSSQVALTDKDITKIKAEPNIISVEPQYSIIPDYIASSASPEKKYQFIINQTFGDSKLDMSTGRTVVNKNTENEITIPTSYISSLGFNDEASAVNKSVIIGITDATGKQSDVNATIVGIQQKTLLGSSSTYGNNAITSKLHQIQTTGLPESTQNAYASVSAVFKEGLSEAQIKTLKSDLKTMGYSAKTVKDQVSTIFTVISSITYIFDGFAAITLLAATFGIVNTLYMSVQERTKEIGLMKALGMSKRKIFTLFSIEAVLIGFWGSILGIVFANIVGRIVNNIVSKGFLKDFTGLQLLSFPLKTSLIIVIGIMVIAFLAGTLPARRASNKDPIEALRYE
ncbi:MAG: FtsX-like permease family protein [Candidatus Saccharibacteria bacterium]